MHILSLLFLKDSAGIAFGAVKQPKAKLYQGQHSAILSTCSKLPSVFKTFVLPVFEWPLKTGLTVYDCVALNFYHCRLYWAMKTTFLKETAIQRPLLNVNFHGPSIQNNSVYIQRLTMAGLKCLLG